MEFGDPWNHMESKAFRLIACGLIQPKAPSKAGERRWPKHIRQNLLMFMCFFMFLLKLEESMAWNSQETLGQGSSN